MKPTIETLRGLYRAATSERVRAVVRTLCLKHGYTLKALFP
jgi:hypothetical protein